MAMSPGWCSIALAPRSTVSRPDMTPPIHSRRTGMAVANTAAAIAGTLALAVALSASTAVAQTLRVRADGLLEVADAPPGDRRALHARRHRSDAGRRRVARTRR